ncbi:MAG: glycosyltransferase [Cytophagales bacterium]|nr:MAG: glycosyltransferase [Cytophagales bacterium]
MNPKESSLEKQLALYPTLKIYHIHYAGKKNLVTAFWRLYHLLRKIKPQTIHTHLFVASLLGLFVAWICGIKQRVYTRHHSTLHHQYFPRAVWYDRFINYFATHIVAISPVVRQVLEEKEGVKPHKIVDIPHGFDIAMFRPAATTDIDALRKKYELPANAPVIGVIARWTVWKGVQDIVMAFGKLLENQPNCYLLLANAKGDYADEIKNLLAQYIPQKQYKIVTFEPNIRALYGLFSAYAHTPIDAQAEAFGQTYIEALAAGIPSVFTLSGIAHEIIVPNKNALVVPYCQPEAIAEALHALITHQQLAKQLAEEGKKTVYPAFALEKMISALEKLYDTDKSDFS